MAALTWAYGGLCTTVYAESSTPTTTIINSDITADTTWSVAGSPYQVSNGVTVKKDITLTIEPGVEVRFEHFAQLTVAGKLVAVGQADQPIQFTGTTAESGWWYGISFNGTQEAPLRGSVLDYAVVEYAGASSYPNVRLQYATVDIRHSTIRHSSANGILGYAKGVANISDSTLSDNSRYPVEFGDGAVAPQLMRLTVTGNGTDAVVFGSGTLSGERTLNNLGVPYILSTWTVPAAASLTIEPGVEVRFEHFAELTVRGRLVAVGSATEPISLTTTSAEQNWWYGIDVTNSAETPATAEFDYATVEYAGASSYANLNIANGQVVMRHSRVRNGGSDGVLVRGNSLVTVEASQLTDNLGYALRNNTTGNALLVMAANNWWGAATGPTTDGNCNAGGTGGRITEGVAFRPFLTAVDAQPAPLLATETGILTIAPQRWFAPADGLTQVQVKLALHDGDGLPLPGRKIRLVSSLGSVVDGGITDVRGETRALLTSHATGDANLTASLERTACETVRNAISKVTFTAEADDGLFPAVQAPYTNNNIEIDPEPIVRGVPTRLRAKLTNPNDFDIVVDATFGFAQAGIGLVFGPVGEVNGTVIPAKATREIGVTWTPVVSGHYCVQLTYSVQNALDAAHSSAPLSSGRSQRNLNVYPGPLGSPQEKDSLNKAKQFTGALSNGSDAISLATDPAGYVGGSIPSQLFSYILDWNFNMYEQAAKALGSDPPRQDYKTLATVEPLSFTPLQPNGTLSAARATAMNEYIAAALSLIANLRAATITLDRYGGAAADHDLTWSSLQANALIFYKTESAKAMLVAAARLEALVQIVRTEDPQDAVMTAELYAAYQERLRTQGFTAPEIAAAKELGLTDEEIEASRQARLALDPVSVAGNIPNRLLAAAGALRNLGDVILHPPLPTFSIGGSAGLVRASETAQDNLAHVFGTTATVQVANPLQQSATLELQVRRIDLPADWIVSVVPITATLAPGEQITATVTVLPSASAIQGATARVAVEGYAGNELLGGVTMDILVPTYTPFDGKLRVFLPTVSR